LSRGLIADTVFQLTDWGSRGTGLVTFCQPGRVAAFETGLKNQPRRYSFSTKEAHEARLVDPY
jgi:hypothetical protein